jgi:hypothetical protein
MHEKIEVSKLVSIYSLIGQMRIQSGTIVIERADEVVRTIIDTYASPNKSFAELHQLMSSAAIDPLRCFSEECRTELHQTRSTLGSRSLRIAWKRSVTAQAKALRYGISL